MRDRNYFNMTYQDREEDPLFKPLFQTWKKFDLELRKTAADQTILPAARSEIAAGILERYEAEFQRLLADTEHAINEELHQRFTEWAGTAEDIQSVTAISEYLAPMTPHEIIESVKGSPELRGAMARHIRLFPATERSREFRLLLEQAYKESQPGDERPEIARALAMTWEQRSREVFKKTFGTTPGEAKRKALEEEPRDRTEEAVKMFMGGASA